MKKIIIKTGIISGMLVPVLTFAATNNLKDLIGLIIEYFNYGVYLIMGLATVMFVFNVFKYFIASGDDAGAKKEAGLYVMYSIIGFFVILSFWGLVNILTNTLNLNSTQPAQPFGNFNPSGIGTNNGVFRSTGNLPSSSAADQSTGNLPSSDAFELYDRDVYHQQQGDPLRQDNINADPTQIES